MNVKNLTTAAVFSAVFIISSLIFIGLGLGYLGYIDFVVPVFMAIIFLKCDLKYSILASITNLLLIVFLLGNVASAIVMVQSMILGIIIGISVEKGKRIYDDILFCSIVACFIIIIFDINFSVITGYSLLKEASEYLNYIPSDYEYIKDFVFYTSIAVIPFGTVMLCYMLTLILGKKLRILNKKGLIKANIVAKYYKYGSLISCSERAIYMSICLFIIFSIFSRTSLAEKYTYIRIISKCEIYIILFFILQYSLSMINKFVFFKTKSRLKVFLGQTVMLVLLINIFKIALLIMLIISLFIENKYKIRSKEEDLLDKVVGGICKNDLKSEIF